MSSLEGQIKTIWIILIVFTRYLSWKLLSHVLVFVFVHLLCCGVLRYNHLQLSMFLKIYYQEAVKLETQFCVLFSYHLHGFFFNYVGRGLVEKFWRILFGPIVDDINFLSFSIMKRFFQHVWWFQSKVYLLSYYLFSVYLFIFSGTIHKLKCCLNNIK